MARVGHQLLAIRFFPVDFGSFCREGMAAADARFQDQMASDTDALQQSPASSAEIRIHPTISRILLNTWKGAARSFLWYDPFDLF